MYPNAGILAAGVSTAAPVGQQLFLADGDFLVPDNVTRICAVSIGQGGTASSSQSGAGGGLAYVNDLVVVPGEVLNAGVGGLIRPSTGEYLVRASSASGLTPGAAIVGTGFSGGSGSSVSSNTRRGGGAGGYTSAGGNAGTTATAAGGGGSSPFGGSAGAAAGVAPTVDGAAYGGGGARSSTFGSGTRGPGCLRIIWGEGRAFPNTNTGDMSA